MLASATAVVTALTYSLRHQARLRITTKECHRYWLKSVNLALCYRGFSPNTNIKSAREAGRAAFYCCAYDVLTDWRKFDQSALVWFHWLLKREVPDDLAEIALKLYQQEYTDTLQLDGLSRGIDALAFVTGLIGSDKYIKQSLDFQHLGVVMQIVDDVLDVEADRRNGETNCILKSPSIRNNHLRTLLNFDLGHFKRVLPHATVLCNVVRIAQKRARFMMEGVFSSCGPQESRLPTYMISRG